MDKQTQGTEIYQRLVDTIGVTIESARQKAIQAVNNELLSANWEIGKYIVEYEQHGNEKAEYGSALLTNLAKDLKARFGKGFSKSNIYLMRQFYLKYQIFQSVTGKLTWTHYAELLGVSDDNARGFYEKQSINENWSVRELKRQISSSLFERLALSKDKNGVLKIAEQGQLITEPKDIVKDPYVLEFLQIPEEHRMTESKLEQRIIDNLQTFLLELGKGFSFVGRQYRITLDNDHYYVDLVFYHRILKCFVLIDLKTKHVKHQDIGQMNMYLNYFKAEENTEGDNPPIGIVLGADKNDILVEYAIGGISNNIFVSKYQLYLPDRKVLEQKVKELITE
ncbi:PDDEXK nuclease domain-containing protein [Plebeiibacterium marinum]|uniref:PDDEXK nuclease domain-containing protein n=1 Tax=Plebeiibacterium marinum TaxID=2992111 RepID=A0AAE3SJU7_9BACT|nr:PDDEXK nuclease domain-containing protein [Plebeiobacterium marinum]MCW3804760.1 PDDEXK nuclease domain-containing protein [Plebeiobacterium marinum]